MALSSFGDMLETLRKRHRITQQTLANQLGVHRNTIGIWERGDFLPETKGMVLELTRHLRLSEPETRALLEASLTGLSPMWNVPYARNPFFTGREEIPEMLHQRLAGQQMVALTQSYALQKLERSFNNANNNHTDIVRPSLIERSLYQNVANLCW